ncbi:hypothetical protein OS493_001600, partial [Desmophyllum pertusum]
LVSLYLFTSEEKRFELPPLKVKIAKNGDGTYSQTYNKTYNMTLQKICEKMCEKTTDKTNDKTTNDKADDKTKDVILKELNEIHLEMQKLLLFKQVPSLKLVERVGELVKRLDNKVQPASETAVGKNSTLDVCPEEYKGGKFGYPFYEKGWVITNCSNAKPLRSVISVLVNTVAYPKEDEKHIEKVLKGITETYPTVQVHLATRSNEVMEAAKKYNNIDVVKVDDVKVSKGWNTLMSKASTPYVLIARDVVHFTWLTQVERQIRVVSQTPNVAVAGGAYRNLSGHWKAGCVQTTLNNGIPGRLLSIKEWICNARSGALLPVCCLEEYADALTFFQRFIDAHNATFELDTGSALGGVKLNGLLPWDIDGDFAILSKDIEIFSKRETIEHFKSNGFSLSGYTPPKYNDKRGSLVNGYVMVNFNGFGIEVWGMWDVTNTQFLPPELQNRATFTKANIRGNWIDTVFSPGLFSRNRYGREILKHSESWRRVGLAHSYGDYVPGNFKPCDKPNHHACLQNFPADGDIPFKVV